MIPLSKKLVFIIIGVAVIILIIVGTVLGITLSNSSDSDSNNENEDTENNRNNSNENDDNNNNTKSNINDPELFKYNYPAQSHVGMMSEYLGNVERTIPKTSKNGGLEYYPVYGSVFSTSDLSSSEFTALKSAIIEENNSLVSTGTSTLSGDYSNYDHMDQDGVFYKNGEALKDDSGNPIKLYKHTASNGMYNGNVSDDEPAISKRIKINSRKYGNHITGLYAPAGEIIKVEISAEDLETIGGSVPIFIGQVLSSGSANNIWLERDFVRMPTIANKFPLDQTTIYIGSHLGGPIYIGIPNTTPAVFSVTISGAVRYPHYIQGQTTEEEWEMNLKSSAPYFDLEVWDDAVRFSGSRKAAGDYSYQELYNCSVLWDKIARVSNALPQYGNTYSGIVFLYEPFVAAGSAVAFQGANTVNAPESWMSEALDAQNFILSGSWGNIHEFNHHYQRYGLPNGGEVTNNAVSLISYSLFTLISSSRTIADDFSVNSWNRFTDPSYALKRLLSNVDNDGDGTYALSLYATILHSFGQQKYIEIANACSGNTGISVFYDALVTSTHYDFTYYFETILKISVPSEDKSKVESYHYPMFIPVASVFQVGRNYFYGEDENYIRTVQPFEISFDSPYTFHLLDSSTFAAPTGFTITIKAITSPTNGKLEKIQEKDRDDGYIYTPDSQFERSGEFEVTLKIVKEDDADTSFTIPDVKLLLEFKAKQPTLPTRTTYYYDTDVYHLVSEAVKENYAGHTSSKSYEMSSPALWYDGEGIVQNCVSEYNAKFFPSSTGTYRLALRGKQSILYISRDSGSTYEAIVTIPDVFINFYPESIEKGYYSDVEFKRGEVIYLKVVLLSSDTTRCFFEIGCSKKNTDDSFSLPSIITKTFDLYDLKYEFPTFTPDYFISRQYTASNTVSPTLQTLYSGSNIEAWDDTVKIENIFDGKSTTFFHSKKNNYITDGNPFDITVDLGKNYLLNFFLIKGRPANVNQSPKHFKLYGSTSSDPQTMTLIYTTPGTGSTLVNGYDIEISFNITELRYFKLEVTSSYNQYVALNGIYPSISGTEHSPDLLTYKGQWRVNSVFSPYGHVYESEDSNATAEFSFTGSFVMITTVAGDAQSYTVSIDDGESEEVNVSSTEEGFSFTSEVLNDGKHTLKIKVKTRCIIASLVSE